ncbi:MAG: PrgI family protein [Candidatus Pacebacteria bacterium]|nr:PrgI family protein [Candidatus Paceibacterota bacterium]
MQFQVPQFIETEDKLVGPLTLRQFLYLAAGAIFIFMLYFSGVGFFIWFFVSAIIGATAASFAFIKVNGQPLTKIAFAAFQFFWKPRLFVWKKNEPEKYAADFKMPALQQSRKSPLQSLWQQLITTKTPLFKREKISNLPILEVIAPAKEKFETVRKATGERETARRVDYR